jgi:glycosyltransferase involved in cell wall biosynthesis
MTRPAAHKPRSLAVVADWPAPFRIHLNRRIAQAVDPMQVQSLFYRAMPGTDCGRSDLEEIRAACFGWYEEWRSRGRLGRLYYDRGVAARIHARLQQDAVQAVIVSGWDSVATLCLMRRLSAEGVPFFMQADSNVLIDAYVRGMRRLVKSRWLRWVFGRAAGVLAAGTLGRKFFEAYGVPQSRIFTVPLEPDYERFEQVDAAGLREFCERHNLGPQRRRLLFAGRLVDVKSPRMLLEAFVELAPERPEWDLVFAGQGPLEESLRKRVPADLDERVFWLGYCAPDIMPAVYHACHVLVLPSQREPWGLVVNEAAASGLALVCSNVAGAAVDLVRDGVSGFTFPPTDPRALLTALREVTREDVLVRCQRGSRQVLEQWRRESDPGAGIRSALRSVGLLD